MKMSSARSFIFMQISRFHKQSFAFWLFEIEAQGNSEMAYSYRRKHLLAMDRHGAVQFIWI